jgi:hypothetical protein
MYEPTDKQECGTARGLAARVEPILAAVAWTDGVIAAVCREIGAAVIEGLGLTAPPIAGALPITTMTKMTTSCGERDTAHRILVKL